MDEGLNEKNKVKNISKNSMGEKDRQYIPLTYIHINPHFPGFIQVLQ